MSSPKINVNHIYSTLYMLFNRRFVYLGPKTGPLMRMGFISWSISSPRGRKSEGTSSGDELPPATSQLHRRLSLSPLALLVANAAVGADSRGKGRCRLQRHGVQAGPPLLPPSLLQKLFRLCKVRASRARSNAPPPLPLQPSL